MFESKGKSFFSLWSVNPDGSTNKIMSGEGIRKIIPNDPEEAASIPTESHIVMDTRNQPQVITEAGEVVRQAQSIAFDIEGLHVSPEGEITRKKS